MAETIIDSLVTLISLKTTKESDTTLRKFRGGLSSIGKTVTKARIALLAAGAAMGFMATKVNDNIATQARFAKSIGVSFENLQELQFAAKAVGGNSEDINESLKSLTKTMSSPIPTEYNKMLLLLGINVRKANGQLKPATELLLDISSAMQKFSAIQQVEIGSKLGLNSSTIRLLQEGPIAIRKAMEEAKAIGGVIPEGAQEQAIEYKKSITELKTTLKGLFTIIIIQITPAVTKFIRVLENLLIKNSRLATTTAKVVGTFAAVSTAFKVLRVVLGVVAPEVEGLIIVISLLMAIFPQFEKAVIKAAKAILNFFRPAIKEVEDKINRVVNAFKKVKNFFKKSGDVDPVARANLLRQNNLNRFIPIPNPVLQRASETTKISPILQRASETNTNISGGNKTSNVTIHINGAQHPSSVAKEVKRQLDLSSALHIASPGFNRPPVA